jgi:Zn-dependent protease with chaperone function
VIARRAHYFDGRSSRAHEVEACSDGDDALVVRGVELERHAALRDLRITPRLGNTPRTIAFADGAQLVIADADDLDALFPSRDRVQSWVDRLERHGKVVASALVICLVGAVALFELGLPWLAERVAMRLPTGIERRLGDEVLNNLDRFALRPSALPPTRQDELIRAFDGLAAGLPDAADDRVLFRDAPAIGANAFALPGGAIVVTDQLVKLFDDDREFLAVVAHELGHEQHRHMLRQALQGSAVAVVAALFAGDVSSAGAVVVAVPTFLLDGHYSRGFESEADESAFATLAAHDVSPHWFAAIMQKLQKQAPDESGLAYLSSHPSTAERILRAEHLAQDFDAARPSQRAASTR